MEPARRMVGAVTVAPEPRARGLFLHHDAVDAGRLDARVYVLMVILRPHDHDRGARAANNLLRDGAERQARDPRASSRADDDKVGAEVGGHLQDLA